MEEIRLLFIKINETLQNPFHNAIAYFDIRGVFNREYISWTITQYTIILRNFFQIRFILTITEYHLTCLSNNYWEVVNGCQRFHKPMLTDNNWFNKTF